MLSLVINSINIRLEVPKKKKLKGERLNVPFYPPNMTEMV
jgi:hypothetical protein